MVLAQRCPSPGTLNKQRCLPVCPKRGIKPLREKWKELMMRKNPSLGTREFRLAVVTCGVTHG